MGCAQGNVRDRSATRSLNPGSLDRRVEQLRSRGFETAAVRRRRRPRSAQRLRTDDGVTSEMRWCSVLLVTVCHDIDDNKDEERVMWKYALLYLRVTRRSIL